VKLSAAEKYRNELGETVAKKLGADFRFYRSRQELRRETQEGHDSIILTGSSKFSPHISINFYFGVNFAKARAIEKKFFGSSHLAHYHIHQYSLNRNHMVGLDYRGPFSWNINLKDPPDIVQEVKVAIEKMALPFFERFSDLKIARDAKVGKDSWCLGGDIFWRDILVMDMALGDMAHFIEWKKTINPFYAQQTDVKIAEIESKTP
jgi:hypothetical protein